MQGIQQDKNEHLHNKKCRKVVLKVGDLVLALCNVDSEPLSVRHTGPHNIKHTSPVDYLVKF